MGDIKGAYDLFKEVPGLLKKKNNQIEAYAVRRSEKMKKSPPTQEYCRLLTLELVFLWHALPTLTHEELKPYLDSKGNEIVYYLAMEMKHIVLYCDGKEI